MYSFLSHSRRSTVWHLHICTSGARVWLCSHGVAWRLGVAQVTTPVRRPTPYHGLPPASLPPPSRLLSLTKTSSNESIHYPRRLQAHPNNDHAHLPCPSILHQNPPALASAMHHDSLRAPADPHQHGRSRLPTPIRSARHLVAAHPKTRSLILYTNLRPGGMCSIAHLEHVSISTDVFSRPSDEGARRKSHPKIPFHSTLAQQTVVPANSRRRPAGRGPSPAD